MIRCLLSCRLLLSRNEKDGFSCHKLKHPQHRVHCCSVAVCKRADESATWSCSRTVGFGSFGWFIAMSGGWLSGRSKVASRTACEFRQRQCTRKLQKEENSENV